MKLFCKEKEEWINGVRYISPIPTYNHTIISGEVYYQFVKYFRKMCIVAMNGSLFLTKDAVEAVKIDSNKISTLVKSRKAVLSPDIAVYSDSNQGFYDGFIGIPEIIVEVLSSSNLEEDTIIKKDLYEEYGVGEYWIVSPMTRKAKVFNLSNNRYELSFEFSFSEEVKSTKFKDLSVDLSELELIYEQ